MPLLQEDDFSKQVKADIVERDRLHQIAEQITDSLKGVSVKSCLLVLGYAECIVKERAIF